MKKILLLVLSLGAGLFAGYVDFQSEEVLVPVLIVLGFAFIFGYLLPSIAWKVALLIGIGVPLVVLTAYYFGYEPEFVEEIREMTPDFDYDLEDALESFLALIPSFIGAYGGVFVNAIIARLAKKSPVGTP